MDACIWLLPLAKSEDSQSHFVLAHSLVRSIQQLMWSLGKHLAWRPMYPTQFAQPAVHSLPLEPFLEADEAAPFVRISRRHLLKLAKTRGQENPGTDGTFSIILQRSHFSTPATLSLPLMSAFSDFHRPNPELPSSDSRRFFSTPTHRYATIFHALAARASRVRRPSLFLNSRFQLSALFSTFTKMVIVQNKGLNLILGR